MSTAPKRTYHKADRADDEWRTRERIVDAAEYLHVTLEPARTRSATSKNVTPRHGVDPSPARHCWVLDPADHSEQQRPGPLVEWHHTDEDEWLGRVIYAAQARPGEWMTLEEWLPAKSLVARPAEEA